ncbi:MAG: glutamate-5-semialdehyde dehydrogenase [Ruminococcaceae bacterium]|nr:glutamate-5-semialdehyde dehydrogenase [Oscillospiraceae bacterium]
MTKLETQAAAVKAASRVLAVAGTERKNAVLLAAADALTERRDEWLAANAADLAAARTAGMRDALLDRLALDEKRIAAVAEGVRQVAALPDPVGAVVRDVVRPNGLHLVQRRVPLGVAGIIYEARPNVTVDAAALCLKAGNAVLLRGGKEAIRSNLAVTAILRDALTAAGLPADCVALVEDTDRRSAAEMMELTDYLDVLIPRGGAGLIRSVTAASRVPVIRTGEGVCHIYVTASADLDMAARILYNAKCSRPSVCNAAECVLVDKPVAEAFFNAALPLLDSKHVELRGDAKLCNILGTRCREASEADWDAEFGDYILAAKTVSGPDEALAFIAAHGTGHSEAIITSDAALAERFLNEVDAAAVYVNASTRFTDGFEFGLGAEIGISTQKLHARGPMGLEELCSTKWCVYGTGQVRE